MINVIKPPILISCDIFLDSTLTDVYKRREVDKTGLLPYILDCPPLKIVKSHTVNLTAGKIVYCIQVLEKNAILTNYNINLQNSLTKVGYFPVRE